MLKLALFVLLLSTASVFAQTTREEDPAVRKAREDAQFAKAADVCSKHITETLPDGSVRYERAYADCYTIMREKAMREGK
jgi:hypothetical protein